MAIYHCSIKIIKRSQGRSAVAAFDGYNHAQMCLAKPEVYVANFKKFIDDNKGCELRIMFEAV